MDSKANLPIGIEDFERIRKDRFYYFDKTRLIKDLVAHMAFVNLFTRPRRFGKTLNMRMQKYFLKSEVTAHYLTDWRFQRKKNFVINIWENFL